MEQLKDRHGNKLKEIVCPTCGKTAIVIYRATYCSVSCGKVGKPRPDMQGKNHPRWVSGDPSYNTIHQRVKHARGRADHCERCGKSGEPGKYEYDWAWLNTGDQADPQNYIALCKKCHWDFDRERHPRGSGMGLAKLTEDIVRECRARWFLGESKRSLAREFGVTVQAMSPAIDGRTWKHV